MIILISAMSYYCVEEVVKVMKSVAGQYECVRKSGFGLDYFTSRVDRLTLQAGGRFVLIVQDRSRISHAAQSLASGQQVSAATPEVRREGSYTEQGTLLQLHFDDGEQQQTQVTIPTDGSSTTLQIGQDVFTKTSDSTLLPSADRLKKDMEDIAKGIKIASTIGGVAFKAMKSIHDTIQSTQTANTTTTPTQTQNGTTQTPPTTQQPPAQQPPTRPYTQQQSAQQQPVQPYPNTQNAFSSATNQQPTYQQQSSQQTSQQPSQQNAVPSVYCDQCGTKARPGKNFCSTCGARLN